MFGLSMEVPFPGPALLASCLGLWMQKRTLRSRMLLQRQSPSPILYLYPENGLFTIISKSRLGCWTPGLSGPPTHSWWRLNSWVPETEDPSKFITCLKEKEKEEKKSPFCMMCRGQSIDWSLGIIQFLCLQFSNIGMASSVFLGSLSQKHPL